MRPFIDSIRLHPDQWLEPLPLARYFGNDRPIDVDVGCGKGRFLVERARTHPETNLLGIDRMLRRIRKIDNRVQRLGYPNVRLLRIEAYYAVAFLMPAAAIQTYYIFFPDPWPKQKHQEHRLFNPRFVDALCRTLLPGGCVHVATDHQPYFEALHAILRAEKRLEEIAPFQPAEAERTDFELWYLDRSPIGRCSFRKPA
jgi:tRNA (guanine-N7-)-methyltransferase